MLLSVDPAVSSSEKADRSALVVLGRNSAAASAVEVRVLACTARRVSAPKLVDLLHAQAQEDLKRITDQQLATTFAIHQAAVEPRGEAWRVSLRGTRQSWSRSQFLGEDRMRYTLEVARTPVSELNPWGLQVSGLRLERDLPDREPRAAARGAE